MKTQNIAFGLIALVTLGLLTAAFLNKLSPDRANSNKLGQATQLAYHNNEQTNSDLTDQKYGDFFTIDCPCDLQIEPNYINRTSTYYKCADLDNKTFYRVSIDNQTQALQQLKLQDFNETFINDFLNEYRTNLAKEKAEYKETTFNGQKAIIYKQNITVDATPITSKSIIFLAHKNSFTLSIMSNPKMADKYFEVFINTFKWTVQPTAIAEKEKQPEPQTNTYKSAKYGYTINIPQGFWKTSATGKNIDLKLINDGGNPILINVTPRQPQEYSITAHDYSVEMLESSIKPYNPYYSIVKSEKTYVDGEEAFLVHYTDSKKGLKAMECNIYFKDKAYVLTATAKTDSFSNYEKTFLTTIKSLKFKK